MVRLKIAYWEFDFEAMCPTLDQDLLSQAVYTVESINNDNCNSENTVVRRHFSIPVFYPS